MIVSAAKFCAGYKIQLFDSPIEILELEFIKEVRSTFKMLLWTEECPMLTWTRFSHVASLVGQSAPPEYLQKLTYLVIRHPQVKRVDTVRAYTFGVLYFVEVSLLNISSSIYNDISVSQI